MSTTTVAERKPKSAPKPENKEERVTFVAEPSWVREIERLARDVGLTLSAYIRVACNEKKKRDAKREDE